MEACQVMPNQHSNCPPINRFEDAIEHYTQALNRARTAAMESGSAEASEAKATLLSNRAAAFARCVRG